MHDRYTKPALAANIEKNVIWRHSDPVETNCYRIMDDASMLFMQDEHKAKRGRKSAGNGARKCPRFDL